MQSVSSRIWTHIAVSIPYDDNHYTTGTSYVIAWLEFELAHYDVASQYISHYAMETSLLFLILKFKQRPVSSWKIYIIMWCLEELMHIIEIFLSISEVYWPRENLHKQVRQEDNIE